MFTVTPEMFNDPNGFYIVCKSQDEVDACLAKLHEIGILWRSGDTLITKNRVVFDKSNEPLAQARKLANEMDGLAGFLAKVIMKKVDDDEDDDDRPTYAILLGNPPAWVRKKDVYTIPFTIGYHRVSDMHDLDMWCVRVKRVLYSNCVFEASGRAAAKEVTYDDEN